MDNKEKLTYVVLKMFYDNIPHNKHSDLKFRAILIIFYLIAAEVLMMSQTIIEAILWFVSAATIMTMLFVYNDIKKSFLYRVINDDYIDKVMDKIKHQFTSKNNIHLENRIHYIYPKDVQVVINNIMKNLTSKKDLATYHDVIKLYKKYEEKADKYEQTEMMEKYVK